MNRIVWSLSTVALVSAFALGCNDDVIEGKDGEPCTPKCLQTEQAVLCNTGFQEVVVCGPSQSLAAANCEDSSGKSWAPIAVCQESDDEADGGDTTGDWPWAPGERVDFDHSTGEYVIDRSFVEELKSDPNPLYFDDTVLGSASSGHYKVTRVGELGVALGWQTGDVLHSVNGREIASLSDYVEVYAELADQEFFELTVLRGDDKVMLSYRIE